MVRCLECGEEFKRISNTHLLNCCKLTMQEYAIKHNLNLNELVDIEVIEKFKKTLSNISEEKQDEIKNKVEKTKRENQIKEFTKEEEQVILGSLLGDGYFFHGNGNYLILEQGIKQLDYLIWKGKKLERLNAKFYQYFKWNSVKQRMTTYNQIRTQSLLILKDLKNLFYINGKKVLPEEEIKKLGPLGLAIWYLDDGNFSDNIVKISTFCFTEKEIKFLITVLKKNFNIEGVLKQHKKYGYFIQLYKEDTQKLFKIIKPYVIPQMRYKINKEKIAKITVCKSMSLDAAHFLTDYEGKCSNMHGGRWTINTYITDYINPETGMVVDFRYVKSVVEEYIIKKLDHNTINFATPELNWRSTAEYMCIWIWFTLIECLPGLSKIRVYETPDSWADYEGPSVEDLKKNKNHPDLMLIKHFQNPETFKGRIIKHFNELFSEPNNIS